MLWNVRYMGYDDDDDDHCILIQSSHDCYEIGTVIRIRLYKLKAVV